MSQTRTNRTYDHRLIRLVQQTGDATIATRIGVPRSTVSGWLRRAPRVVVSANSAEDSTEELHARVVRLERRLSRLSAMLRVILALVRIIQPDLRSMRVPEGDNKQRLLRAIQRSRGVLGLRRVLRTIGLSPTRLSAWQRAARGCDLDDESSCPGYSPQSGVGA